MMDSGRGKRDSFASCIICRYASAWWEAREGRDKLNNEEQCRHVV